MNTLQAHYESGEPIKPGEVIIDSRGTPWNFVSADRLGEPGRSAKITAQHGEWQQQFYAEVFGVRVSALPAGMWMEAAK
jgi:hypothetical protein